MKEKKTNSETIKESLAKPMSANTLQCTGKRKGTIYYLYANLRTSPTVITETFNSY